MATQVGLLATAVLPRHTYHCIKSKPRTSLRTTYVAVNPRICSLVTPTNKQRAHSARSVQALQTSVASVVGLEENASSLQKKVAGKTVVITGGSQGVGQAVARRYAQRGYNVVVVARQPERLQEVADECNRIRGRGEVCVAVSADVSKLEDVERAYQLVSRSYESVDLLVCNAGVCANGLFVDTPTEECERIMGINFFGSYYMLKAFLPAMIEQAKRTKTGPKPSVAVVNSFAARLPLPNMSVYTASKYALQGLVDSLRYEVAEYGIHVAQIHPGVINSSFLERATYFGDKGQAAQQSVEGLLQSSVPMVQTPDEVAQAVEEAVEQKRKEVIVGAGFNAIVSAFQLTGVNAMAAGFKST